MKNKGLKIFGGLIALVVGAFIILTLTVDGMVKSGIEDSGSQLMGTEVEVDGVSISLFNGSGSIDGFRIQNPEDFSDESAVEISEITMTVDIGSLLSDQVIVEDLVIQNPAIFFEQEGFGANLQVLNNNMNSASGSSSEKAVIIERLLIEDGSIRVSTSVDRERNAEATFSSIELEGIGRDGSNTTTEAIKQVIEPMLQKAIQEAVQGGVIDQIENRVRDLFDN